MPVLNLDEIIKCLGQVAKILFDRPEDALKELRDIAISIDNQVPYYDGHTQRVCEYSLQIGRQLGLSESEMVILEATALLHDIGKIGIDESALTKPSKLTPEERQEIQYHVLRGFYILQGFEPLNEVTQGIRCHHEKFDGSGYPDQITNGTIPLVCRIIAVADSYDAMTSARPYRRAKTKDEAMAELQRCSGTEFDPIIVEAFIKVSEHNDF